MLVFFVVKQKTAYEMRISDWSSDVCSSDLRGAGGRGRAADTRTSPRRSRGGLVDFRDDDDRFDGVFRLSRPGLGERPGGLILGRYGATSRAWRFTSPRSRSAILRSTISPSG